MKSSWRPQDNWPYDTVELAPPRPPRVPIRVRTRLAVQRMWALRSSLSLTLLGFLFAILLMLSYSLFAPAKPPLTQDDVKQIVANAMASATPPPPLAVGVFQTIHPSLVQITTRILGTDGKSQGIGGTGVILDEFGDILTALHVVKQAIDIKVTFADGTESPASKIGEVPDQDIAVLRPSQLPAQVVPAVLGNPGDLQVGDDAIAVGNPFGLTNSLTQGVISGLKRNFRPPNGDKPITGLIQFDAAINPGNSGGPLLNRSGEVVGIVTGLVNPTDQDVFIGIGFAVPIDVAAAAAGSPPY